MSLHCVYPALVAQTPASGAPIIHMGVPAHGPHLLLHVWLLRANDFNANAAAWVRGDLCTRLGGRVTVATSLVKALCPHGKDTRLQGG